MGQYFSASVMTVVVLSFLSFIFCRVYLRKRNGKILESEKCTSMTLLQIELDGGERIKVFLPHQHDFSSGERIRFKRLLFKSLYQREDGEWEQVKLIKQK